MPGSKTRVVVTSRLPATIEGRLSELFDVQLAPNRPFTGDELKSALQSAHVLIPTITDRLSADVLACAGPQLKMIANYGNGTDHIDINAAHARGLLVTNTPSVLTEDVADVTMALLLMVIRRLVEGAQTLQADQWPGWSPTWMLGRRLTGLSLGIVGMGRIGRAVAQRASAFGLQVHYHSPRRLETSQEDAYKAKYWPSLDQMLARMDIVSIHCPHTPATYHLLSERRLQLMRADSFLINTARGEIVDEAALGRLMDKGHIAGAGLDVFEREPAIDRRLKRLSTQGRVLLLPHMGSATLEGRVEMGQRVIRNIQHMVDGHQPPDRVLPELLA